MLKFKKNHSKNETQMPQGSIQRPMILAVSVTVQPENNYEHHGGKNPSQESDSLLLRELVEESIQWSCLAAVRSAAKEEGWA